MLQFANKNIILTDIRDKNSKKKEKTKNIRTTNTAMLKEKKKHQQNLLS